ncbi:MAG: methylenetetrahydrofolate--tRNA-(uracil(54)-C(5))-methyltransferase (FADH(2)-oxidizing) TrmFO [Nitrospiraceae bacterium]|nr:methylenetetrahydrofolate--tRNA-(uracil(54)-C(5))-methyltransferase (FADH(2)-oxidizing) TrmFO [Nitrospiraceae bacterium]
MSRLRTDLPVVTVVGAGLAGTEAAMVLSAAGHRVRLFEMRPLLMSGAHKTSLAGELVCSNSLKSLDPLTPHGLLKEELLALSSPVIGAAFASRIPGGGALVVDRDRFSALLDRLLSEDPKIQVIREPVLKLPRERPLIIATGPLTHPALIEDLSRYLPAMKLSFYDAIAPIVDAESLDMDFLYSGDRHGVPGQGDYLNAPMSKEIYYQFCQEILHGEKVPPHEGVEDDPASLRAFSACQPIESLVESGIETLAHGPLRPVGLADPRTGAVPYAVVQLRRENLEGSAYNLVGFQTRLRQGEQARIFRMIPGLSGASFLRFGSLHRNTFVDAPSLLLGDLSVRGLPGVYITGQLLGVEGYTESVAMGHLTAMAIRAFWGVDRIPPGSILPPRETALGSLLTGLSNPAGGVFCPINLHFGLFPEPPGRGGGKNAREPRRQLIARSARKAFSSWLGHVPVTGASGDFYGR